MQLPFELHFERPTWPRLRSTAGIIGVATTATVIVGIAVLAPVARLRPPAHPGNALTGTLQIASVPVDATVEEDGRRLGRAPGLLSLPTGEHQLTIRADGYSPATYRVRIEPGETVHLDAALWLRDAPGQLLRSPLPGAAIANATFIANGDVALLLSLPSSAERQLWILSRSRRPERVGPTWAEGPMAISPDGLRVATLAPSQGSRSTGGRLEEVWISARSGGESAQVWVLPATRRNQVLVDVGWAPDSQHLLLVAREQGGVGGTRSYLLWLTVDQAELTELLVLPGEVVPGSFEWSPDGRHVAFLVRTPQATSLCLMGTADGVFRYLGDVRSEHTAPLPYSPLGWSTDGRRFASATLAAATPPISWWTFGGATQTVLSVADLATPQPQPLGKAKGQSPAWRRDGGIVALAQRQANGPLVVELIDAQGGTGLLSTLPLGPASTYAARWDLAHAQALVAVKQSSGGGSRTEYWLVRFDREPER